MLALPKGSLGPTAPLFEVSESEATRLQKAGYIRATGHFGYIRVTILDENARSRLGEKWLRLDFTPSERIRVLKQLDGTVCYSEWESDRQTRDIVYIVLKQQEECLFQACCFIIDGGGLVLRHKVKH